MLSSLPLDTCRQQYSVSSLHIPLVSNLLGIARESTIHFFSYCLKFLGLVTMRVRSPIVPSPESVNLLSSVMSDTSPLLRLPADLLPHLRAYLPYPDLLALRHTHPYFYYSPLVSTNTNVRLKIAWLVDRKERGLPCPTHTSTLFKTDREFCASTEVKLIMARRRRHKDCTGGKGGCEVVTGRSCEGSGERGMERDWLWSVVVVILAISLVYLGHLSPLDFSVFR